MKRRWIKRWLKLGGVLLGAFLLVVLLLPFWFPWVLEIALGRVGAQLAESRCVGWSQIVLQRVEYRDEQLELRAEEVRLPQPAAWLWGRMFGSPDEPRASVSATNWLVVVKPTDKPARKEAAPFNLCGALDQVADYYQMARRWLPNAALQDGTVRLPGNELRLPAVRWDDGRLRAVSQHAQWGVCGEVLLATNRPGGFSLAIREHSQDVALNVTLNPEEQAWTIAGTGRWLAGPIRLGARFGRVSTGPWPERFEVSVPELQVPAERVKLSGYSAVQGRLQIRGVNSNVDFEISASAAAKTRSFPDLAVDVAGHCDPKRVRLDRLLVQSRPLKIALSNPAHWSLENGQLAEPCRVSVAADLAGQTFIPATGQLAGDLHLTPRAGTYPGAVIQLQGNRLVAYGCAIESLRLQGEAVGALLDRAALELRFEDTSSASVAVEQFDVAKLAIGRGQAKATVRATVLGTNKPPVKFDHAALQAEFAGTWPALHHKGGLSVDGIKLEGVREAGLSLDWVGEAARQIKLNLMMFTDQGRVRLAGNLEDTERLLLDVLSLRSFAEPPLVLERPATVVFTRADSDQPSPWKLTVSELTMTNQQRGLSFRGSLAGRNRGTCALALHGWETRFLAAFLTRELPPASLDHLGLSAAWDQGPLSFDAVLAGSSTIEEAGTVRLAATLRGDADGVHVTDLRLRDGDIEAVHATGTIPLRGGILEQGYYWEPITNQAIQLELTLSQTPTLRRWLARRYAIALEHAVGTVRLAGPIRSPTAQCQVRVAAIQPTEDSAWAGQLPQLTNMEATGGVDPEALHLDGFRLELDNQPVEGTASLPLAKPIVEQLRDGGLDLDLGQLSAHLKVAKLSLASLPPGLQSILRPEGELKADVRLQPDWHWQGEVALSGIATRALPSVGPLRDVHGRVVLADQEARLEDIVVDVGGARASLHGSIDLSALRSEAASLPAFELSLDGKNLPLARGAGLIVRSDLALRLAHLTNEAPIIAGEIRPQRSFFLGDLKAVFGSRVRSAERPPPYFRVEQAPFGDWRLDLAIQGDRFFYIKSPFYKGVHSANLKLRGTLKEPLLVGDVRIAEGRVLFPYATLPVSQGFVSFNELDPQEPKLTVLSGARTFGYEVRMEVTGTLKEPAIQFSSSPPLSSEEIVLMITAGQLPRDEIQYSTTDRLAKMATLVGKDVLNKLGAQDATEERLIVRSGERISSSGKVTHSLEYRLTEAWSLIGEYDEFDDINAGVKWRILRR